MFQSGQMQNAKSETWNKIRAFAIHGRKDQELHHRLKRKDAKTQRCKANREAQDLSTSGRMVHPLLGERDGVRASLSHQKKYSHVTKLRSLRLPPSALRTSFGFTLIELVVAMALMAAVIPLIYRGLQLASLAGEVAERKALASRIAERVLNQSIIGVQNVPVRSGSEPVASFQFRWTLKDEPWKELSALPSVSTPNGINQTGVSLNNIHQYTVEVTYAVQGRDYSVHLSTLVNVSPQ